MAGFEQHFPRGTRIYASDIYVIYDPQMPEVIPASDIRVSRTSSGVRITNTATGVSHLYPASTKIVKESNSMESAVPPGVPTPVEIGHQLACGQTHLIRILAGQADDHVGRTPFTVRAPGNPWLNMGGPGTTGGDLNSSNDECVSGGEELGFAFSVPTQFAGSTVTMCSQNSRTSICFSHANMSAGEHYVSAYLPGFGPTQYSMGLSTVAHFRPGCSQTYVLMIR